MKILDRYIVGKFLSTFFLTIALILMIAVVFDISEKLEDFVSKGASMREILLQHYANFLVYYGNLFSSMIVFIATIFFTSRMTARSEIVAILTGGVSFNRLLWPYFIASTLIMTISMLLGHFVIPKTNVQRLAFEWKYILNKNVDRFQNIHKQILPEHIIFLESYNSERQSGLYFSYEHFEGRELKARMQADFIRYDSIHKRWRLDNAVIRTLDGDRETLRTYKKLDTALALQPEDLSTLVYRAEMMTTPELLRFIELEKQRGSETVDYFELERYKRTAWPISTYILVLIALSLSSRKTRGGLGLNIALGLALCVSYIFFMQISTTFATKGDFPPLIAVWIPNFCFAILALYLYVRAPK